MMTKYIWIVILCIGLISLASAQFTTVTTTVPYYVLNPSGTGVSGNFITNSTTVTGLLNYESGALCNNLGGPLACGIMGTGLEIVVFLVVTLTLSFVVDFTIGVIVGAFIADGAGLLLMQIGILPANIYFIFVGLSVGAIVLFLVRGSLRPY